jgi:hypothetical protein
MSKEFIEALDVVVAEEWDAVLGVNLLASWLRIVFDPKEREKRFAAAVQSRAIGGGG